MVRSTTLQTSGTNVMYPLPYKATNPSCSPALLLRATAAKRSLEATEKVRTTCSYLLLSATPYASLDAAD